MIREIQNAENSRLGIQISLDSVKTPLERNKSGQFATPPCLSKSITEFVSANFLKGNMRISFLEPALGTGSFYSSLLSSCKDIHLESAVGIEIDKKFADAAQKLWAITGLQVINADFLAWKSNRRFDLVLTNPPYVRHHHIDEESKLECKSVSAQFPSLAISGLSGLYVYFLIHSVNFMAEEGLGVWLIPSEWMNVNYGKSLRRFLTSNVTLLHIHNYNISDVKFEDALVSSSVVIFRNAKPVGDANCKLSYGTDINSPSSSKQISFSQLRESSKWLNLFNGDNDPEVKINGYFPRLGDFFYVKRGIATGSNDFFIKPKKEFEKIGIHSKFLKPILPPSRALKTSIIESDRHGYPELDDKIALIDTDISIENIKTSCPELFSYLTSDQAIEVSSTYLASHRIPWYSQEKRPPAPFLCTYMGRNGTNKKIFRFFYNKSMATATNGYLLLIPRPLLESHLKTHEDFCLCLLDFLNSIPDQHLISNGRNYGGGLYKMEPKELGNIDASFIAESLGLPKYPEAEQISLFSTVQEPPSLILRPGAKGRGRLRELHNKGRRQETNKRGLKDKKKSGKPPPKKL